MRLPCAGYVLTMSPPMSAVTFPFRFEPSFRLLGRFFGVSPQRCAVTIDDGQLTARFGFWTVVTETSNIADASVTGPYRTVKVIGPPHLSMVDGGLTFATNAEQGVCISFRQPVHGSDPLGLLSHRSLTVTVDEPARLAELLRTISQSTDPQSHRSGERVSADVHDAVATIHDHLEGMTAAELRRHAQQLGIPRASKMSKAALVSSLSA